MSGAGEPCVGAARGPRPTTDDTPTADREIDCEACQETFDSGEALEEHVHDVDLVD